MSIGSISSNQVSTTVDRRQSDAKPAAVAKTISDHVAELDQMEPIRSASTKQGTLLDTYL